MSDKNGPMGMPDLKPCPRQCTVWPNAPKFGLCNLKVTLFSGITGEDSGGTIILVGQDGVQRPPIHFPRGGHLIRFLSCLENGLLPHGQLDPPLWSQKGKGGNILARSSKPPNGVLAHWDTRTLQGTITLRKASKKRKLLL